MADLGHLRLHLSASLGQLRADLAAAKLLAKNTRAEMQAELRTPIEWGLTRGLSRELIAVESMFAASLNRLDEMAARGVQVRVGIDKRSLIDAEVEIQSAMPDVKLRVGVDKRSITDAVVEIHSAISHINSEAIKIRVDDSALTRLNAHYKLKWQDHDETVRRLAKPIVLHVDDSELRKHHEGKQVLHQKVTIGFDYGAVDRVGKDIGRSIENAIHAGGSNGAGRVVKGLRSIAVAPIKVGFEMAAFPVRELAKGMLQGFGRDLSKGLSQSFAGAINESLSSSIGSMDLVGRKLGEVGTREVKRAYVSYTTNRPELSNSVAAAGTATRSFLGEKEVAIEANKVRGKAQQKQRQDLSLAQTGVLAEIRSVEAELNKAEASYVNAVRALKSDIEALTKEQVADQSKYQQIARLRQSGRLTPARSAIVDRQQQQLVARESQRSGTQAAINNQLEPRAADVTIAQQRKDTALQQMQALMRTPQPKVYQQLIDQIAPGLPEHLIPELVPRNFGGKQGDGRTTSGRYSSLHNRIEVTPEIYKQVQAGKLDENATFALSEEIRHAEDFKFGQFEGVQANGEKRLIKKPVTATIAEEKAIAANVLGYRPEDREIERNAKIKANRDTARYLQQQATEGLTKEVGPGGLFMQTVTSEQFGNVQQRLDNRSSLAKEVGKKLPSFNKLEQELNRVKAAEAGLIERITVAQTSGSSPEEIAQLRADVQNHLKSIDSIDKRVGAAGRAIPKARGTGEKSSAITLNQVGDAVSALGGKAQKVVDKAMPIVQGVATMAQQAYGVLEGAEGVMLGALPGGKTTKKVLQSTAVPAALYGAVTHGIPGGQVVAHGMQSATQAMLSLPAGGVTGALDGVIAGSIGHLPGVGSAVSAAVSSLSGGIVELAVSSAAGVMAPILGGAAIQKAGSNTLKAITPSTDTKRARALGQGAAEKLRDSFEVTISPLEALPPVQPTIALPPAKHISDKEVLGRLDKNLKTLRGLKKNLQKDISSGALNDPGVFSQISNSIEKQIDDYKSTLAAIKADPERSRITGQLKNRKGQFTRINNDIQRSLTVAKNSSRSIEGRYESYSKGNDVEQQLSAMRATLAANPTQISDLDIFKATYNSEPDPDEEDQQIARLKAKLPKRGIGALKRTRKPRIRAPLNNAIYDPGIVKAQNLTDQLAAKVQEFEGNAQQIKERVGGSINNDNPDLYRLKGISRQQQRVQARGLTPEILAAQNVAARAKGHVDKYDRAAETIEAAGFTTTPKTPLQAAFSAVTAPLAQVNKGFESLKSNFTNLGVAGGGILALAGITTVITAWGASSVQTAAQLKDLGTSFNLVTRSQAGATAAIQQSTALSDRFGTNKIQGLQSDVGFRAATKDTAIELVAGDITDSVTQYGRVAGLSSERLGLTKTALQQIAGKEVQAEEVFGQGEESFPGFARILASGSGLTIQQLRKQLERGSLNSADVLPRFASTAKAESNSGADAAAKSTTASMGRLANAVTDLQAATGEQLLAPATVGLNAAAGSAKFLADNMGVIGTVAVSAIGAATVQAIGLDNITKGLSNSFKSVGSAISNFAQAPVASLNSLKETARGTATAMAPLATSLGITAAIALTIGAFQSLSNTLSNDSPMREAAAQMAALAANTDKAAEAAQNLQNEKFNKDRNIFELFADTVNAPVRGLGVNVGTVAQSKAEIDIENIKRGQTDSVAAILKNSGGVSSTQQEELQSVEQEIRLVRARRATLTTGDRNELTAADKQEQDLVARRKQLEQPIFDQKANLKSTIRFNQNLLDDPYYRSEAGLEPQRIQALANITKAEQAIAQLDKALGKTPEESDKARRGLERLSNELSTTTAIAQRTKINGLTEVDQRATAINPLDTGGRQGETFKVNQRALSDELAALQKAISKAEQEISRPIFKEELSTFKKTGKLPSDLQNTSDDQLSELEKLKASPELVAIIRKIKATKDRIDGLNQENAGQIAEYQRSIAENARSAREYYRSATADFQKSAIDAQSARQSIVSADLGSRYKSAIQGVGGSLTSFITTMTEAMVEMRTVTQIELDRRKKDLALQQEKISQGEKYRNEVNTYGKSEITGTGEIVSPLPGVSLDKIAAAQYAPSTKLGAGRRNQATGQYYPHQGQDLGSQFGIKAGSPIVADISGTAKIVNVASKGRSTYGVSVVIESPDGLTSKSTHLTASSAEQALGIKVGGGSTPVRSGQFIGKVAALGLSGTEDHLHKELWRNGSPIDPLKVYRDTKTYAGNRLSSASGSNISGINPRLMTAMLDYIGKRESNNNYYAKNDGGSFPRSEAAVGFPKSQSFKQAVRTKTGIKWIMPNVGRYQFNLGDYEQAQKIDPTITNFLPENQDKIAKIKIERLNRGGKELLQFQQSPTPANVERVRRGFGNEWQIFHRGDEPGATSADNYWGRNGNNNEKFFSYLKSLVGSRGSGQTKNAFQDKKTAKGKDNDIGKIASDAGYAEKYSDASSELVAINGERVARDAADAFKLMQVAAAKEKINLRVISGYRSTKDQKAIFDRKGGGAAATKYSAPPGYSQHHTGLAIDINSVENSFAKTKEHAWLQKNAASYGFIKPYANASGDLGPENEPWHWAFAGNERSMRQFKPFIKRAKGIGYDPLLGNQRLQSLYGGQDSSPSSKNKRRKESRQAQLPGRDTGILLAYDSSIASDSGSPYGGLIAGNDVNARGFGNNSSANGYNWGGSFTGKPAPAPEKHILPSRGGVGSFADSIDGFKTGIPAIRNFTPPVPAVLPLPEVKKSRPAPAAPQRQRVTPNVYAPELSPLPSKIRKRKKGVAAGESVESTNIDTVGPLSGSLLQDLDPSAKFNTRAETTREPGSGSSPEENLSLAKTANEKIQASLDEQRTINNESAAAQTRNAKRQSLAKERQAERDRIVQQRSESDKIIARERDAVRVKDPIGDDTPQKRRRIADRERVYAGKDRQLKLSRDLQDLEQEIKAVELWQKESKSTPDKDLLPEEIRIRDRIAAVVKVELPKLKNAAANIRKFYLPADIKSTNELSSEADRVAAIESKKNLTEARSGTRSSEITKLSELKKKSEVHLQSYPLDYKKFGDPLDYQKQIEVLNAKNTFEAEKLKLEKAKREDPFNAPEFDKQLKAAEAAYRLSEKNAIATYHSQFRLRKLGVEDSRIGLGIRKDQGVSAALGIRSSGQEIRDKQDAPFANNELLKTRQENELLDEQINLKKTLAEIEKERRQYAGNKDVTDALDAVKNDEVLNSTARQELIVQKYAFENATRDQERKKSLYDRSDRIQASGFAVQQAGIDGRQALGISPREEGYKLQIDQRSNYYDQQVRNLQLEKSAITGTGEQAAFARREIDSLIADMERLRSIELGNLAKQFDPLNQALNSVQRQTRSVFEEFTKTGKFDIGSIFKAGIDNLLGKTLDKLTTDLFANLYRGAESAGTNPAKGATAGGGVGGLLGSILGSVLGFAAGGSVVANGTEQLMAKDGLIAKGLRREEAKSGGKGTMIFATIGEEVLDRDEAARYRSMFPNGIEGHATGGTIGKLPPQNKIKLPPLQNAGGLGLSKVTLPSLNQSLSNISNNNSTTTSNVTVNNSGGTPQAESDGSQFGELLGAAIVQKIIELQRQGLVPRPT
jgi:tape measure domain-containing protein